MILPNSSVLLDVRNLHANINDTPILKGLNLTVLSLGEQLLL